MSNYKLHYAKVDLGLNDTPCFEFEKHSKMIDFIDEKCISGMGKIVWLIAKEDFTDLFISESHLSIQDFLSNKYTWQTTGDYYLQEYSSFLEAYKVALSMVEVSPLCYSE